MFYYLSKTAWYLIHPVTLLGVLTLITCVLCFLPWQRLRRWMAGITLAFIAAIMIAPIGPYMSSALENRFAANPPLGEAVDGIIVLGGSVDPESTAARGHFAVNSSFDRVIAFAELAERFPSAKLVYSGGSHAWIAGEGEADMVGPLLSRLDIDLDRVVFEGDSRNTWQNAVNTLKLIAPGDDETWVIITSGYHMPRAIGAFRNAGWPPGLIAYPVDFRYMPDFEPRWFSMDLKGGLGSLAGALHEMLGLLAYYLTDRSDSPFPAPEPPPA